MNAGPELFFGLVGAVGTDLKSIVKALGEELRAVNYVPAEVHLSDQIAECHSHRSLLARKGGPEDDRIDAFMNSGDALRTVMGRGDAVALLALMKIQAIRKSKGGSEKKPLEKHAFILNSLKHPDEISSLQASEGLSISSRTQRAWPKTCTNP